MRKIKALLITLILFLTILPSIANISPWQAYENFTNYSSKYLHISSDDVVNFDVNIIPKFIEPDFEYDIFTFHDSAQIYELSTRLAEEFPDRVKLIEIGESWQNKSIYVLEITNGTADNKPFFFIVGAHHAREMITAEAAFYIAAIFASTYGENSEVTEILNRINIAILPVLNPDGLDIALNENDWQRKNARPVDTDQDGLFDEDPPEDTNGDGLISGYTKYWYNGTVEEYYEGKDNDNDGQLGEDWIGGVDLNRNYPYGWGTVAGHDDPASQIYQGPEPASEPEIKSIMEYMAKIKPIISLSLHSGIELLLYPWGYWNGVANFEENIYLRFLDDAYEATGWEYQKVTELYPASGVWDDWAFGTLHSLALTAEIYGNSAWRKRHITSGDNYTEYEVYGIKWMFNPNPDTEKDKFEDTLGKTLALVEIMGFFTIELLQDKSGPVPLLSSNLEEYLESGEIVTNKTMIYLDVSVKDDQSGIFSAETQLKKDSTILSFNASIPLYHNKWEFSINTSQVPVGKYSIHIVATNRANITSEIYVATLEKFANGTIIVDYDGDNDHLADIFEMLNGADPNNPDTDGDGVIDGEEYKEGGWNAVLNEYIHPTTPATEEGEEPFNIYLIIGVFGIVMVAIAAIIFIKKRKI